MTTGPDEDVMKAVRRLERLAYKLPVARDASEARVAAVDGWPERDGSMGRGSPDPEALTSVEAAAHSRLKHSLEMRGIDVEMDRIAQALEATESQVDNIVGYAVTVPRCTGGAGQDGAREWGEERCQAKPEQGRPLCARCRKAKNRWAKGA